MAFTKRYIEAILASKINEWIDSILVNIECKSYPQTKLRDAVREHYVLTGGAIVSLLQGEEPNDYDIYMDNIHVLYELVSYYLNRAPFNSVKYDIKEECYQPDGKFKWHQQSVPGSITISKSKVDPEDHFGIASTTIEKSKPVHMNAFYGSEIVFHKLRTGNKIVTAQKVGKGVYEGDFIASNCIGLTDDIQLITRICGNPGELTKSFDFAHCVSYYTEKTGLVLNKVALESIVTKELKYLPTSPYPMASMFRVKKFLQRGWTISDAELLKIMLDIVNLDTNKDTIAFQLQSGIHSKWNSMLEELKVSDLDYMKKEDIWAVIDKTT